MGVYQEFYSSALAKEKYVSGFLQWGECFSPGLLNMNKVLPRKTTLFSFFSQEEFADVLLGTYSEM